MAACVYRPNITVGSERPMTCEMFAAAEIV